MSRAEKSGFVVTPPRIQSLFRVKVQLPYFLNQPAKAAQFLHLLVVPGAYEPGTIWLQRAVRGPVSFSGLTCSSTWVE